MIRRRNEIVIGEVVGRIGLRMSKKIELWTHLNSLKCRL